jgi:hypothetical protein
VQRHRSRVQTISFLWDADATAVVAGHAPAHSGCGAVYALTIRMILRCLWIERPNPAFLAIETGYEARFLSADELRRYTADPTYDLSPAFVDREVASGHRCLAIRHGGVLVSYGWYCTAPTRFTDSLRVHFDDEWVYMHKGFTHAAYRGRRLHAIGMSLALNAYIAQGYRGLVTIVAADNGASLASCARMGYRRFGTIYTAHAGRLIAAEKLPDWLDRTFVVSTPGCRDFGFRLRATSPRTAPRRPEPTTADLTLQRRS